MCKHETKVCASCNTPFECKVGNIAQCQCSGIRLSEEERNYLAANYTDCLCMACLQAIRNEIRHRPILEKIDKLQASSKPLKIAGGPGPPGAA